MRLEPRDTVGKPPFDRNNAADKAILAGHKTGKLPFPAGPGVERTGDERGGLPGPGKPVNLQDKAASPASSGHIKPGTEAFTRLAGSLGVPADALQAAIVSFSRYFSLPLEPGLLMKLRREVLSLKTPREAGALGAAAAADKGAALSPRALEDYAAAIEGFAGDDRSRNGERDERRDQGPPEEGTQENASRFRGADAPSGRVLRERTLQNEAALPLLGLLNRLPGREGRRWMVFPFTWSSGDVEFRVSLRVVLDNNRYGENRVSRLALDVLCDRRRWSFTLDQPGGTAAETRVSLFPPPPEPERESLKRELRDLLGSLGGPVSLSFEPEESLFGDSKNDILLSINEEV